jgi:hypothetical protein
MASVSLADTDDDLAVFCRLVRARSEELQAAMRALHGRGLSSVEMGLLRQELDSMVRVTFLLSQPDRQVRRRLVSATVAGERWTLPTAKGKQERVKDATLVEAADRFQGWTRLAYRFGCSFIHLSDLHDHQARDPFRALPQDDRRSIVDYLRHSHGGDVSPESSFADVMAYVPRVLGKISTNLESYLKELEQDDHVV